MRFGDIASLYANASSWVQSQMPLRAGGITTPFEWSKITPHKHLVFHPCFDGFQCARLRVPMDWLGGSPEAGAGKTVDVAVIKLEAKVPVTDPRYGGPVLTNPGGPGGSGIVSALDHGRAFQTIVSAGPDDDDSTAKFFDLISFDPRGVNNTQPAAHCYPNHIEAAIGAITWQGYGGFNASDISFDNLWAHETANAHGCSNRLAREGIGKHMSTPPVARDMIEIVERHGEWREQEAKRLLSQPSSSGLSQIEKDEIIKRVAHKPGKEQIQYWGFSYGTILGATMSAIFPERISRAVLDGVSDAFDYIEGGWVTNLRDTDRIFTRMAEYCFQGGPDNCEVYEKGGPSAILEFMRSTISSLAQNPVGLPGNATHGPIIVTIDDFGEFFATQVYNPIKLLPRVALVLKQLSQGNGTELAEWKRENTAKHLGEQLTEQCKKDGPYSDACFPHGDGYGRVSLAGIQCSDAFPGRFGQSKEDYRKYANQIMNQSIVEGERWASITMPCTRWNSSVHWQYKGNYQAETAHPILFAGNTVDPVTPLYNAIKMAKGFKGAGVLHQDTEGHCTPASPVMCSGKAIRRYFQTGELPGSPGEVEGWDGVGAFCQADQLPFDGYSKNEDPDIPKGEHDIELWKALVAANKG